MAFGVPVKGRACKFTADKLRQRALRRIAIVLHGHWEEGTDAHSRIFETLIPDCYVFFDQNGSRDGWREHIVPCSVIRNKAFELFDSGESIETVTQFIDEHLKIFYITREQRDYLDFNLGLKTSMPANWKPGDTTARLREAGIDISRA